MTPATIAGLALVAGAVYLYFRPGGLTTIQDQIASVFNASAARNTAQQQQAAQLAAQERQRQYGAASATASGASAAAIGLGATAAVTAGITAGAGLLAWGIIDQGWFRGGWEGVTGNPIRDRFIDQFVQIYYPGAGAERQYEAMVRALAEIGIVGSGEPGSSVPNAGELISQLYAADRADEMQQAINRWAAVFAAKGIRIATPTNY